MQTIQQQRAKYALEQVNAAAKDKSIHSEYKSYASSLPAMIHMNGLGQAVAFFKAKSAPDKTLEKKNVKERAYFSLYQTLSNWLCGKFEMDNRPIQPYDKYRANQEADVLTGITKEDMHAYRLAQAESQALMDWVKKFAKAIMTEDNENKGSNN